MIRVVLVGWSPRDWRIYRQPQWIGQVRRQPEASSLPRRHFDMDEEAYLAALRDWDASGAGADLDSALEHLGRLGAIEVRHP